MPINIQRFDPNKRAFSPSSQQRPALVPVRFDALKAASNEASYIAQSSSNLAAQSLGIALKAMQHGDNIYYSNLVVDTQVGLAGIDKASNSPEEYTKKANAYVDGISSSMSGKYKGNFLLATKKTIAGGYLKKQAIFEKRSEQLAIEGLNAAQTSLTQELNSLSKPLNELEQSVRDDRFTQLDNILTRQKALESTKIDITDPQAVGALEAKYSLKRQNIMQEQGMNALLNHAQTQNDPYSTVMELMSGESKLAGFEDLTPQTLRKALGQVQVIVNGQRNAQIEEDNTQKQLVEQKKLDLSVEFAHPTTIDSRRSQIKDEMLLFATSIKERDQIYNRLDEWENRHEKAYVTTDRVKKAAVSQMIYSGNFEQALDFVQEHHTNGISTKERDSVRGEIAKLQKGLFSSPSMRIINSQLSAVAPNKIDPLKYIMSGGNLEDLASQDPNAFLVAKVQETILNRITSNEITTSDELQAFGKKMVDEVRNTIKNRSQDENKHQSYITKYKGDPNLFIKNYKDGSLKITKAEFAAIHRQLVAGSHD